MKLKIIVWLTSLLATLILTIINYQPYIFLGGSSSVAPLMEEIIRSYNNYDKEFDFSYNSGASSAAEPNVKNDRYAIGWLSKQYDAPNDDFIVFQIMKEQIVIIVNLPKEYLNNPNETITLDWKKIKEIYVNPQKYQYWQQVIPKLFKTTSENLKIIRCARENGSGTREFFNQKINTSEYSIDHTAESSSAMLGIPPGGIGYSSEAEYKQEKRKVSAIKIDEENNNSERPFTGLIKKESKYKKPLVKLLSWLFNDEDTEVTKIFKKYGIKVCLNDEVNTNLKKWLKENKS